MGKQLDLLRRLIREEVSLAVRTELKLAMQDLKPLLEGRVTPSKSQGYASTSYKDTLKETVKPVKKVAAPVQYKSSGDPIQDLLMETQMAMQPDEYRSIGNFGAQDAQSFGMRAMQDFGPKETIVTDNVSDILQAARPASEVSGVQLPDAVPDFSHLMKHII